MINLDKIKANVTAASSIKTNRNKVTTIDEARKKVADKLAANHAFLVGESNKRVDKVYTVENGIYTLGAKYGNRWLKNLFGDGQHYITGMKYDEMEETLDMLVEEVVAGEADDCIRVVMENNKRNKLVA